MAERLAVLYSLNLSSLAKVAACFPSGENTQLYRELVCPVSSEYAGARLELKHKL